MSKVTHRTFVPQSVEMFKIKSYDSIAEKIRQEAVEYMNQIGAENVISITEKTWHEGYSLTVWHRIA